MSIFSVLSYPETAPQIDFKEYRTRAADPAVIDELEKIYKSLKIPYPKDTQTAQIDQQEKEDQKRVDLYCKDSVARAEEAKAMVIVFFILLVYLCIFGF